MKRETVTAILLGLMAALPFGLLQHNWILAICFGVLVGVGMAPQHVELTEIKTWEAASVGGLVIFPRRHPLVSASREPSRH